MQPIITFFLELLIEVISKEEDADEAKPGKIYKKFANPVKNTSQNVAYDDTDYGEEEEEYDKDTLRDQAYEAGLKMYKRYGLTKEQLREKIGRTKAIRTLGRVTYA